MVLDLGLFLNDVKFRILLVLLKTCTIWAF